MKKTNPRKIIRNVLLVVLVINFLALVLALTHFVPNNPLIEYRLLLGISFIVMAGFARQICNNCGEQQVEDGEHELERK